MTLRAVEGEITWLPGISPDDLPYPLPRGINLHARRSVLGIEAQGVVGTIPLKNGVSLRITPKIGMVNFLRLLFRAEGMQHELNRDYEDFVTFSVDEEQNIESLVARQIFFSASEIMSRSPLPGRKSLVRTGNL